VPDDGGHAESNPQGTYDVSHQFGHDIKCTVNLCKSSFNCPHGKAALFMFNYDEIHQ
jgi:hypothetical protein